MPQLTRPANARPRRPDQRCGGLGPGYIYAQSPKWLNDAHITQSQDGREITTAGRSGKRGLAGSCRRAAAQWISRANSDVTFGNCTRQRRPLSCTPALSQGTGDRATVRLIFRKVIVVRWRSGPPSHTVSTARFAALRQRQRSLDPDASTTGPDLSPGCHGSPRRLTPAAARRRAQDHRPGDSAVEGAGRRPVETLRRPAVTRRDGRVRIATGRCG